MPNKKAAIKDLRQTAKRTESNSLVKRNIKEIIKRGVKSIDKGTISKDAPTLTKELQKAVDKAVKTGVLKANTGNRKKSRFASKVKAALGNVKPAEAKTEEKK